MLLIGILFGFMIFLGASSLTYQSTSGGSGEEGLPSNISFTFLYTSEKSRDDLISIRSITTGELGNIAQYLPELSRIRKSLEYVTLKKPYGITIKLKGTKEVFYPGETDFAGKLQYYMKLKRKPPLNKYDITCVDLRFKDRFYFEYDTEVIN